MALNNVRFNLRLMKAFHNGRCRSSVSFIQAENSKITVDDKEVEKLSKLASKWWDDNGEMRALHSMNKLRVQLVRDCLLFKNTGSLENSNTAQPLKGLSVIDVGCGGGILSEPLARIGAQVTGLDASPELIDVAKAHMMEDQGLTGKLEYVCGSIEEQAKQTPEKYDAVVASEVLEHVVEKELFLESCANILKPNGSIFITTLNKTMLAWVAGVMTAEYVLQIAPKETHDWEKFVSPHEVQYMLEKHGCDTKLVHGMFYNFICNEWMWTNNTTINYALHAVKKK